MNTDASVPQPLNGKYRAFPQIHLPHRQWPSRAITTAPIWCSVDLRDCNQALATPMNVARKLEFFYALVACGFKQIEIGFPSASETEFGFVRRLIEEKLVPNDVWIQVLVPAREELIEETIESLVGAKRVIIHLYNSTSPAQRRVVFGKSEKEIIELARQGALWIKERLPRLEGTEVMLQYSPESFSATELSFSKDVSDAVIEVWRPTPERKMILNLPCTVEVATPNTYADQIEWMCANISQRDSLIISLHTHNDRGTGVAATELGLLAGADRVEGTLFGNGERTGNLDIITVALNLQTQGIKPGLNFSRLAWLQAVYEECTGMIVPPRHPYSGELVFTAFSGSHQDAIKKGLAERECNSKKSGQESHWDVPYLLIDPSDIGRTYNEVIRVNGQSGKGGLAYLLEREFGIGLPRVLQADFGRVANSKIDALGREVNASELREMLLDEYECEIPWRLESFSMEGNEGGGIGLATVSLSFQGDTVSLEGKGNGPVDAFVSALNSSAAIPHFNVSFYEEASLGTGTASVQKSSAIAYIQIAFTRDREKKSWWGVAVDTSIEHAALRAILSALNRACGIN